MGSCSARSIARRASRPTRSSFTGIAGRSGAGPARPARRLAAGTAPAARALDGGAAGRRAYGSRRARASRAASSAGSSPITPPRLRPRISPSSIARSRCPRRRRRRRRGRGGVRRGVADALQRRPATGVPRSRRGRDRRALRPGACATSSARADSSTPSSPVRIDTWCCAAKERGVLRPHGQILRTGDALVPDEASLTSTAWMGGVFHSMVTQGHVSINRFLSTTHSYLGLFRSHGQRVFVEGRDGWQLLDAPVGVRDGPERLSLDLPARGRTHRGAQPGGGRPRTSCRSRSRCWTARRAASWCRSHVALGGDDGADAVPLRVARDERRRRGRRAARHRRRPALSGRLLPHRSRARHRDRAARRRRAALRRRSQSRSQPFLVLVTAASRSVGFRITGHLVGAAPGAAGAADGAARSRMRAERFWRDVGGSLRAAAGRGRAARGRRRAARRRSCPGSRTTR